MFNRRQMLLASALTPSLFATSFANAQTPESSESNVLDLFPSLASLPGEPPMQILGWTDVAALAAYVGLDGWPKDLGESADLIAATQMVALDSALLRYADQNIDALLGFDLSAIDQGMFAFQPPYMMRAWSGRFDPERIARAFTGEDYVEASFGDKLVLSSPTGDGINLDSEISRIGIAEFNYLIVSDDRLVTTGMREMLDLALAQETGSAGLSSDFADSPLPEVLAGSTSALVFAGESLSAESMNLTPTDDLVPLPAALWFGAGVTLVQPNTVARLLIEFAPGDAEPAAEIIAERITNGTSSISAAPLSDVLGDVDVTVLPDTGIVEIAGDSDDFARNWLRMIYAQDLAFLATE